MEITNDNSIMENKKLVTIKEMPGAKIGDIVYEHDGYAPSIGGWGIKFLIEEGYCEYRQVASLEEKFKEVINYKDYYYNESIVEEDCRRLSEIAKKHYEGFK